MAEREEKSPVEVPFEDEKTFFPPSSDPTRSGRILRPISPKRFSSDTQLLGVPMLRHRYKTRSQDSLRYSDGEVIERRPSTAAGAWPVPGSPIQPPLSPVSERSPAYGRSQAHIVSAGMSEAAGRSERARRSPQEGSSVSGASISLASSSTEDSDSDSSSSTSTSMTDDSLVSQASGVSAQDLAAALEIIKREEGARGSNDDSDASDVNDLLDFFDLNPLYEFASEDSENSDFEQGALHKHSRLSGRVDDKAYGDWFVRHEVSREAKIAKKIIRKKLKKKKVKISQNEKNGQAKDSDEKRRKKIEKLKKEKREKFDGKEKKAQEEAKEMDKGEKKGSKEESLGGKDPKELRKEEKRARREKRAEMKLFEKESRRREKRQWRAKLKRDKAAVEENAGIIKTPQQKLKEAIRAERLAKRVKRKARKARRIARRKVQVKTRFKLMRNQPGRLNGVASSLSNVFHTASEYTFGKVKLAKGFSAKYNKAIKKRLAFQTGKRLYYDVPLYILLKAEVVFFVAWILNFFVYMDYRLELMHEIQGGASIFLGLVFIVINYARVFTGINSIECRDILRLAFFWLTTLLLGQPILWSALSLDMVTIGGYWKFTMTMHILAVIFQLVELILGVFTLIAVLSEDLISVSIGPSGITESGWRRPIGIDLWRKIISFQMKRNPPNDLSNLRYETNKRAIAKKTGIIQNSTLLPFPGKMKMKTEPELLEIHRRPQGILSKQSGISSYTEGSSEEEISPEPQQVLPKPKLSSTDSEESSWSESSEEESKSIPIPSKRKISPQLARILPKIIPDEYDEKWPEPGDLPIRDGGNVPLGPGEARTPDQLMIINERISCTSSDNDSLARLPLENLEANRRRRQEEQGLSPGEYVDENNYRLD